MSVLTYEIRRGTYLDSIVLMQLQSDLARLPDIEDAGVMMATSANLELLRASSLLPAEIRKVGSEDLVIVVRAASRGAARAALARVDGLLATRPATAAGSFRPRSLTTAVRELPAAGWVLISIPGRYAAAVARHALALGRHVFLYSDNVDLRDEASLKQEAAERGLLVMGPDCGTAVINGIGFGFANRVRRGPVGLVCASGTGLQAIATRVHELGAGVSHAIGTGGRDLHADVGAITARQGLDLLARDSVTRVLILASKPPDRGVGADLLATAMRIDRPVVVYFSGVPFPGSRLGNLHFARSLDHAAEVAVDLLSGDFPGEGDPATRERGAPAGWVRGLFAGGTLALEAAQGLGIFLGPVYSNFRAAGALPLPSAAESRGHTVLDLGTDELTVGRLHPMMDQQLRLQRLRHEASQPDVGSIVLDVVLGSGAHPDPAAELAPAIAECTSRPDLQIVTVVVGTDQDRQDLNSTVERLEAAGALVYRTISEAVRHLAERHARPVSPLPSPVAQEAINAPVAVVNVGLESFYHDLIEQQVPAIQVDWRPPAGGNETLMALLERMGT